MRKFGEVICLYDPDSVSSGTAGGSEVPSGTPATGTSDANSTAGSTDLQAQLEKLEKDRRAQQAVYDRKLAEAERQRQELAQKLEQFQTQGMDDTQKVAFERDQYKQRLAELEAQQRISAYANAFCDQFKIDRSKLDMTNEETIAQSGWAAIAERMAELEQRATGQTSQAPEAKTPPQNTTKIITGSGGVPRVAMSQTELMTQIAHARGKQAITEEDFYQWAQNNPEQMTQWLLSQSGGA